MSFRLDNATGKLRIKGVLIDCFISSLVAFIISIILYVLFFHKYKLNILKSTLLFFTTIFLILTTTIFRVLFDPASGYTFNSKEFYDLFISYFNIELFVSQVLEN